MIISIQINFNSQTIKTLEEAARTLEVIVRTTITTEEIIKTTDLINESLFIKYYEFILCINLTNLIYF